MKPGYQTTEFWVTAIVNVTAAVVAILAARGLMTAEEGELWIAFVGALAVALAPLAAAVVTKAYVDGRSRLKLAFVGVEGE